MRPMPHLQQPISGTDYIDEIAAIFKVKACLAQVIAVGTTGIEPVTPKVVLSRRRQGDFSENRAIPTAYAVYDFLPSYATPGVSSCRCDQSVTACLGRDLWGRKTVLLGFAFSSHYTGANS
jgi:hypothetical protein